MSAPATIVRELTPRGAGGVTVLEVRGPDATNRVEKLLRTPRALRIGSTSVRELAAEGEVLDEAVVWCECESRVEVHLHASPPLVRRVVELLGGEEAPRGATLRERALDELSRAASEDGARILLDQAEGAWERALEDWRTLDDRELARRLELVAERSRVARYASRPACVVLAGPVNAGKSTLANLLHGRERLVVSPHAGTTRDAVVERVRIGAWPVDLVDTAGERDDSSDPIEREGLRIARAWRERADLVLWLSPAHRPSAAPPSRAPTAVLTSLADLDPSPAAADAERISVKSDPAGALITVERVFRSALGLPERCWLPGEPAAFDERSVRALREALALLHGGSRARATAVLEQG